MKPEAESLRDIVQANRARGRADFEGIEARQEAPDSFLIRINGKAGRNLSRLIAFFDSLPASLDPAEGSGVFGKGLSLPAVLHFMAQGLWGNGAEWQAREMARLRIDLLPEAERAEAWKTFEGIPWE